MGQGISKYDPYQNKFSNPFAVLKNLDNITDLSFFAYAKTKDHYHLFGTNQGLIIIKDNAIVYQEPGANFDLLGINVYSIFIDPEGQIWAGSKETGLFKVSLEDLLHNRKLKAGSQVLKYQIKTIHCDSFPCFLAGLRKQWPD
ncbi:MAG: hypothetical protein HC896_03360 [Bacteroidales bacterium]|nr:hypothetical protein [Bacteroidales bacterium]